MNLITGGKLPAFLREPLLHFLLIGIAVFTVYWLVTPYEPPQTERRIEVTQAQVERLSAQFEAVWNRPPTDAERTSLIDAFVREEIYYREALALGLDRDDTVIRRRLQQKMEFLTAPSDAAVPTDADLSTYFADHIDRYTSPSRITFRQVFLDGADPKPILAKLAGGTDPLLIGRSTLLPAAMEMATPTAVDGSFGDGFFSALSKLEPGRWSGPVSSAYGQHLVEVVAIEPAVPPALDTVRMAVVEDWRREAAETLRESRYKTLHDSYEVVLPSAYQP